MPELHVFVSSVEVDALEVDALEAAVIHGHTVGLEVCWRP
jgi:hypothetical protein